MIFNEEVKKLRGVELNTIPMIQGPFEEMIKELERGALTRSSWAVVHFHELLLKFSLLTNLSIHLGEDLMGKDLFEIYANVIDTRAKGFGSLLGTSRELSKILQKMKESNRLDGSSLQHAENLHVLVEYFDHSKVGGKDIVQWRNTQLAHATALSSEDDQNNQKDLKSLVTSLVDFLTKNKKYFNKTLSNEVKLAPFISQREHIAYLYDQLKKDTYYPLFVSYNSNADQLVDKENKEIKAIYDQVKNCLVLDNSDSSAEGNTYTKEEKETIEQISKDNRHEKFTFINELLNEAIQENPTGARFLIRMESGMGKSTFVRQMLGRLGKNSSGIIYKAFFCNNIFAFSHETFTNTCLETLKQFEGSSLEGLTLSGRQGFKDSMVNLFNDALNIYKERSQDNTKIVFFIDGIDELTLKNENFLKDFLEIDLNKFQEQIYFVFTCRSKSDTSDYINQIIDKNNFSKILEISKKDEGYQQMMENFVKKYRPNITNEALKELFKYIDNKFLAMDLYIKILDELPDTLEQVWDNDAERYLSSIKSLYGGINYREIEKLIAYFCLIPLPITLDLLKGFVGAQNITFQLLCYLKIISPLIDTRRGEYETYFSITRPEFTGYGFESTQDILEDMKAEIVEYYDESLKEEKIKDYDFVKHFSNIISLKYNKRNLSSTVDEIKSIVQSVIEGQEGFEEPELKDFTRDFNLAMALIDKAFLIRKIELLLSCVHPYLKKKEDLGSLNYLYDKNKDQKVLVQSLFFISYYNVKEESPDELLMYANNLLGKLEYIESPEKIKIIEKMFAIIAKSLPDNQVFLWAQTLNRMADILTQASRASLVIEQMENLVDTLKVPEKELLKQSLALAYLDVQEFEFAKQSIIDARNYINNTRKPKILAIQNATYRAYIENISKNYDISVNILKPYRSFVDDIRLREQSLNDLFIIVKYFEVYADAKILSDPDFAQQCLNRALEIYSLIEHKYKISVLLYQVDNYITRSLLHKEKQESYIILQKGVSLVEQYKHAETSKLLIKLYEAIIELFRIDTNINNNISTEARRKLILEYSFKIIDICDSLERNNLVFDKAKKLHMVARISELSKDLEHLECIKSFRDLDKDNYHIQVLDAQYEFERAVLENNIEAMETLTKDNNIDLNYLYDFDKTALVLAVEYGSLDAAKWLIDHGSDVNILDIDRSSALSIACGRGYINIVEKILSTDKWGGYNYRKEIYYSRSELSEGGYKLNTLADSSPLVEAAKNSYLDIIKLLLDYEMDIDLGARRGENALISSLKNGCIDVAKYLIEQGADINYKGKYVVENSYVEFGSWSTDRDDYDSDDEYENAMAAGGPDYDIVETVETQYTQSPIELAIEQGNIEIIQLLISKGVNDFLLFVVEAVEQNNLDAMEQLLNAKPHFSAQDKLQIQNIFKKAAIRGKAEVVKKIIEFGIGVNEENITLLDDVENLAEIVSYKDFQYLIDIIRNGYTDTFLYLLKKYLSKEDYVKECNKSFIDAVIIQAALGGHIEILQEISPAYHSDFFIDTTYKSDSFYSGNGEPAYHMIHPLHAAAQNGHLEVIKFLLKLGADINLKGRVFSGVAPIYLAIENRHLEVIKFLLGESVSLISVDSYATYLELVINRGYLDIMSLLLSYEDNFKEVFSTVYLIKFFEIARNKGYKRILEVIEKKITKDLNAYLILISIKGERGVLKGLLDKGADINIKDSEGKSPVHHAVLEHNLEIIKELLTLGADINIKDNDGKSPLYHAVLGHNLEIVKELLAFGADINIKDNDGKSPVHHAVLEHNLEIIKELLTLGADINIKDNDGKSPLYHAVLGHNLEIVKELLAFGADINIKDNRGKTLLYFAMQSSNLEMVRLLLDQEVGIGLAHCQDHGFTRFMLVSKENQEIVKELQSRKININIDGIMPFSTARPHRDIDTKNQDSEILLHAAVKNLNLIKVKKLLDQGMDVNAQDSDGRTPLYFAAQNGDLKRIKELIDRGADINTKDKTNISPLHVAFKDKDYTVAKFLLDNGANLEAEISPSYFGLKPEDYFMSSPKTYLELASMKGDIDMVSLLLNYQANLKDMTNTVYLSAPLEKAKNKGYKEIVQVLENEMIKDPKTHLMLMSMKGEWGSFSKLLDERINIDIEDSEGRHPLHFAAKDGNLEIVRKLLELGINVDIQDSKERTPLHFAAKDGNLEMVKLLLDCGADMNIQNRSEDTPFHFALEDGNVEIIREFLDRGVDISIQNGDGETSLNLTIDKNNIELVKLFLDQGATIDFSSLEIAAKNSNVELVKLLLDQGVDINLKDLPLDVAVKNNNIEMVRLLLGQGATTDFSSLKIAAKNNNVELVKLFLDQGVDINTNDSNDEILYIAIENNNLEMVQELLARGVDINLRDDWARTTPLYIAVKNNNIEMVQELLSQGADINVNGSNREILNIAVENNNIEMVRLLLGQGATIDFSSLEIAAKNNNVELLKLLLDQGVDINTNDSNGEILYIAVKNNNLEMVELLLARGATINTKSTEKNDNLEAVRGLPKRFHFLGTKNSLVHTAVKNNNVEIVKVLLAQGADINARDSIIGSPLTIAVENNNIEMTRLLLDWGADIDVVGKAEQTPLTIAMEDGNLEITKELLDRGGVGNYHNKILLYLSVQDGNLEAVKELLDQGEDINSKYYREILLYLAGRWGDIETQQKLRDQNVSRQSCDGQTLLYLAVQYGHIKIVKELLDRGININIMDYPTLRHIAIQGNQLEIVKALWENIELISQEDETELFF